ncbi:MAG: hypothetical protein AUG08_05845 [Acidobacteria bacterium 13_1_20CM_2_55_15]|nr:MAG: hypothetical protein AUG08_05845 [Acidobacteria bacterium 13_1_20CM_2_55_15]
MKLHIRRSQFSPVLEVAGKRKLDAGRRRSTIPQCRRRERQRELATNQYDPRQIRLAAKVSF